MTPTLWTKTTGNYRATVQQDWVSGHGPFEGRYRYTVVYLNEYEPHVANGKAGTVDQAIERAEHALALWVV